MASMRIQTLDDCEFYDLCSGTPPPPKKNYFVCILMYRKILFQGSRLRLIVVVLRTYEEKLK